MASRSLLSDKAILRHRQRGTVVIEPYDALNLSTSSYDVTLGPFYYRETVPAPGCDIFNPFSAAHVKSVWGQPLQAEQHKQWCQRTGQMPLEGIGEDERLIWIKPGETILAHTNEFIGGRGSVTSMMKARSSLGRCFIELCKCFPANVRLLTRRGYKFVEFIDLNDEVASYNPSSQELEFHRPSRVFKKSGIHSMVQVKQQCDEKNKIFGSDQADNHVELATTEDHDWFVHFGRHDSNSQFEGQGNSSQKRNHVDENGKEKPFTKCSASSLIGKGKNDNDFFQVLTSITNGSTDSIKSDVAEALPWADMLGLDINDKCDAFLEFYGYWLGNGTIKSCGDISCTSIKKTDKAYVAKLLTRVGFKNGIDYISTLHGTALRYQIKNKKWNLFFLSGYRCKYEKCNSDKKQGENMNTVDENPEEGLESYYWPSESATKLDKLFLDWVFFLNVRRLRLVIKGLTMANPFARDVIVTCSIRFRDQLMRILLFAGYSPHFKPYRKCGTGIHTPLYGAHIREITASMDIWQVFIGKRGMSKIQDEDVKAFQFQGDVYCLTVPNHLVIAQTAIVENGVVTSASKSIVIGQCAGWGDVSDSYITM